MQRSVSEVVGGVYRRTSLKQHYHHIAVPFGSCAYHCSTAGGVAEVYVDIKQSVALALELGAAQVLAPAA